MIRESRKPDDGPLLVSLTIDRQHTEDVAYVGTLPLAPMQRYVSTEAGCSVAQLAVYLYRLKHDRDGLRGMGLAKARVRR